MVAVAGGLTVFYTVSYSSVYYCAGYVLLAKREDVRRCEKVKKSPITKRSFYKPSFMSIVQDIKEYLSLVQLLKIIKIKQILKWSTSLWFNNRSRSVVIWFLLSTTLFISSCNLL